MQKEPNEGKVTSSRKREHVEVVVSRDVAFRAKTSGFERFEFEHNALPEINLSDITTGVSFLGKECRFPLIISSMTGGYPEAAKINGELAELCAEHGLAMGVGSQRQALQNTEQLESFRAARKAAPRIPIFGNIGAAEMARGTATADIQRLAEMIEADGFAVHLNPLQELMQPEGSPEFRGVLPAIERLVRELEIPVIVKEVGAGLSANIVRRLLDAGVRIIDIAGAGGTSWSGVELLRRDDGNEHAEFWDWGIPTTDAIIAARPLCDSAGAVLIGSGGITGAREIALALALGAHMAGTARPIIKLLQEQGQQAVSALITRWKEQLRRYMFLTGSETIEQLRSAPLRAVNESRPSL